MSKPASDKLTVFFLLFSILFSSSGFCQVALFSDNFNANNNAVWSTTGAVGTYPNWSVNRSGADWGARVSNSQLELTNDASASGQTDGWAFAYRDLSAVSGYSTTLSSNTGIISWEFNMRQIRPNPGGFCCLNSYGVGVILAGSNINTGTTGSGYAVVLGLSGSLNPVQLIRYNNGMRPNTQTPIISSSTSGLTTFGTEYLSVRITYNPSGNVWELFLRNDGSSAFSDPSTGNLVAQGSAVDATYTGANLPFLGAYWQGSTTGGQTSFFDNINLKITGLTACGYSQDFNMMGSTGTAPPPGWRHQTLSGSNSSWTSSIPSSGTPSAASSGTLNNLLIPSDGSVGPSSSQAFNLGATGNSDRALGTWPTSVAGSILELTLINGSGASVSQLNLSYSIRRFTAGASPLELPGYWIFVSTNNGSSWTEITALRPNSGTWPNTIGVGNFGPVQITLPSTLASGAPLRIRWVDDNSSNNPDQVIGIDNVNISLLTLSNLSTGTSALCEGSSATISLSGMLNVSQTISYTLGGTPGIQTASVIPSGGIATFSTPALTPANSIQFLNITGITRTSPSPSCALFVPGSPNSVQLPSVTAAPAPPSANAQSFCSAASPTVASLSATGTAIKWYAASSGGAALAPATALATGIYYATQTVSGCESVLRTGANITLSNPTPPSASASQSFCSGTSPTVASLSATGTAIKWYAVSSGGTALAPATALATGTYYATQTLSGCESTGRTSVSVTVITTPVLSAVSAPSPVCASTASLVFSVGTVAGVTTYNWTVPTGWSITAGSGTNSITLTSGTSPGTISVTATNSCGTGSAVNLAVKFSNYWTGATNNDFMNAANWSDNVLPSTGCPNITFPTGTPPAVMSSGSVSVTSVVVQSGASLTLNGGQLGIAGNISNSGTFNAENGTIWLNGSSTQTLPGVTVVNTFQNNAIKDLIIGNNVLISNSASVPSIRINGTLSFGNVNSKTLTTRGKLVLASTASGTARVADLTNNGSNTGNTISGTVTVERYIPPSRSWRLLTVPLTGTQTINAAWQEGVVNTNLNYANNLNPNPGYGIHISGSSSALGFDPTPLNNPSLRIYNVATGTWSGITNTLTTRVTDSSGYMVFVRGNRSTNLSLNTAAPTSPAILRASGTLKLGTQAINIPATVAPYAVVGNPFASAIDLRKLSRTATLSDGCVIWDPKLGGSSNVGGYQYVTRTGADYTIFPGGGSFGAANSVMNTVQSGQAVLIQHNGAGTLTVSENAKDPGSSNAMFRPIGGQEAPQATGISLLLQKSESDGSIAVIDGVRMLFDSSYNNDIDLNDFRKADNFSENLAMPVGNLSLAINKRRPPLSGDTIQFRISRLQLRNYRFQFSVYLPDPLGLQPMLDDAFTGTQTLLGLQGNGVYDFTVTGDSASSNSRRFKIIFKSLNPLPIIFTSVSATRTTHAVRVDWSVADAAGVAHFRVERSTDGRNFSVMGQLNAPNNGRFSVSNSYNDLQAAHGPVFYRIRSIGFSGEEKLSAVVSLLPLGLEPQAALFPNPLTGSTMNLSLSFIPAGEYSVRIINHAGQVLGIRNIACTEGANSVLLNVDMLQTAGTYLAEISGPGLPKSKVLSFQFSHK